MICSHGIPFLQSIKRQILPPPKPPCRSRRGDSGGAKPSPPPVAPPSLLSLAAIGGGRRNAARPSGKMAARICPPCGARGTWNHGGGLMRWPLAGGCCRCWPPPLAARAARWRRVVPARRRGLGGTRPGSDAVPIQASRSGLRPPLVSGAASEERDGEVWSPKKSKAGSSGHDDGDACGRRSLHIGAVKVLHSASTYLLCSCTGVKTQIPPDWAAATLVASSSSWRCRLR